RDAKGSSTDPWPGCLKRNDFRLNRHFTLAYCLSMIFSDLPSPAEASYNTANGCRGFAQAGNRYPLFGIMLYSTRRQDHHHLAAFEARLLLDLGDLNGVALDAVEQLIAELLVRHFAAAEPQ